MSNDVAQRDLDQAGHRITNVGTPAAEGDATKTDNTTVPLAAAGAGSPGESFLAAPVDHVHPAGPGGTAGVVISLDDPSEQATQGGPFVIWQTVVNFDQLPGARMIASVGALVRALDGTGTVQLKIGGAPGQDDGAVAVAFDAAPTDNVIKGNSAEVDKPAGLQLVKLLASTPSATVQISLKSKTVLFRSL